MNCRPVAGENTQLVIANGTVATNRVKPGDQVTPSQNVETHGDGPAWSAARDVVGKNATVVATVVQGLIGEPETLESLFGRNATQVSISGQPAWHGPSGHGLVASLWMRQPFIINVMGSDLSTTDAVLAAMIAAQPAT